MIKRLLPILLIFFTSLQGCNIVMSLLEEDGEHPWTQDYGLEPNPTLRAVSNGDFLDGMVDWEQYIAAGAAADFNVINEVLEVYISGTTEREDVILSQAGIYLEAGRSYTLGFDAYTSGCRDIDVYFGDTSGNQINYSTTHTFHLDPPWISYEVSFFMSHQSNENAALFFKIGGTIGDISLDRIRLSEGPSS